MAVLQITNGSQQGQQYELTQDKYVLGRHPDCDIVVDAGAVSRQHAQVLGENGRFFVEDLKSRNGTYVNGQLIQHREPLAGGDVIQICDLTLRFFQELVSTTIPDDLSLRSSHRNTFLIEDDSPSSTILSKVEVSTSHAGGMQMAANPEAKLRALIEINKSLGRALSLDEVLPNVLDGLFKIFVQADRGFIVLQDPQNGELIPRWTKVRREDDNDNLRISRTIVKQVMDSQEAILSADAASDTRFEMSQSIADFRIRSMMCGPLLDSDGQSFGVLQIDTLDQRSRFQPEDLEVHASVASQAALAIVNAQLHEAALRQREIERDLELAKSVQKGFLPEPPPILDGYRFFSYYRAANHIGGDYYDYIELPDGRVAIVVADVVGHGVAAALLMAKLAAEVRIALAAGAPPAEAVTKLNARLENNTVSDRFVTLVLAVLDPSDQTLTVVNAGHMAPMIRRDDAKIEEIGEEEVGVPLAIDGSFEYEQATTTLQLGDLVAMYTDGINEAMDEAGDQYGVERLRELVVAANRGPESLGTAVIADVQRFVGQQAQYDDMCLVCVGRDLDRAGSVDASSGVPSTEC